MTHMRPMAEHDEDVKYTCTDPACGYVWWVDGIDS